MVLRAVQGIVVHTTQNHECKLGVATVLDGTHTTKAYASLVPGQSIFSEYCLSPGGGSRAYHVS